jgi:hypothetical protein
MSNDLRTRGFKFAGPTICYAFMQAAGMVNDHTINCFRSQFQNVPFCPISTSGSNFNPRNTQCIPVVKIFAFLDLDVLKLALRYSEILQYEKGTY